MSALNDQHGGNHYKNRKIQPVELWAELNLNGFQASIVKYITRHKDKNGAQDIDKAEHFFALMRELNPSPWWHRLPVAWVFLARKQTRWVFAIERYTAANKLSEAEEYAIRCALVPYADLTGGRRMSAALFRRHLADIREANGYPTEGCPG